LIFPFSHTEEEGNKKRKHDDFVDCEVNSKSELHLVQTQFSFLVMNGDVSWCKTFAFEEFEGKEALCSIWSKPFPFHEVLGQNFSGVGDLAKMEKVG